MLLTQQPCMLVFQQPKCRARALNRFHGRWNQSVDEMEGSLLLHWKHPRNGRTILLMCTATTCKPVDLYTEVKVQGVRTGSCMIRDAKRQDLAAMIWAIGI